MSKIRIFGNVQHCLEASPGSTFSKMMKMVGHRPTTEGSDYDLGIIWAPWSDFKVTSEERAAANGRKILNDTGLSHLKSSVAKHFERTFGYPITKNPMVDGQAVEKSDDYNGTHSGRIVACPIEKPEPGKVYQHVIDNTVDDQTILDVRTPIVGGEIPFVWKKFRPTATRFSNTNKYCELHKTENVFSADEIASVQKFATNAGLEWGELDIIRDRFSNRIYIVDLNNTPMGPPNGSTREEGELAIALIAGAFSRQFL